MKITKAQLRNIIKEELEATIEEEAPMQEGFMQNAVMKLLSMLSPGLAETAQLTTEYPEFAKAVNRHGDSKAVSNNLQIAGSAGLEGGAVNRHGDSKAVSNNLQIAGAAGLEGGSSQLRRALEKDEAEVVRALDDFVAGDGSSSRVDLNLGMRGGRFSKR
jgi:hypothetical protein